MSFLPRLFRLVLPTSQHPFSPQLPTSVASSAAGPSRIQWYHGPKIQKKQKTNKAAAARFKLLKSGEVSDPLLWLGLVAYPRRGMTADPSDIKGTSRSMQRVTIEMETDFTASCGWGTLQHHVVG